MLLVTACGAPPRPSSDVTPEQLAAFRAKEPLNAFPSEGDPYTAEAVASPPPPAPAEHVCALRYVDAARVQYELHGFDSAELARGAGFIVTHQGDCGTCSTLADLALYLERPNLTAPVRDCAAFSDGHRAIVECLMKLGFTSACADTWAWNARHTRQRCFDPCLWAWLSGEPSNRADGSLNTCLQCDEDQSGPVFKATAGRTRRNSGIHSSIARPDEQVFPIVHDYF